jgi:hypothetical protein
MAETNAAAFGIFSDRLSTENAIETLKAAGFRNTDISSLFPDDIPTQSRAQRKGTRAVHGAVKGAGLGAVIGSALGWLAAVGTLPVPESATLLATAPGLTSLASLGAGSMVGILIGALAGRRIPRYREHYEGRVRRGDILISVHCDDPQWTKKAMVILKRTGAADIASTRKVAADFMKSNQPSVRPVREKTIAPPLRLVVNRSVESKTNGAAADETPQAETLKKSAAS